jgi:hypothetical protein
MRPSFSPLLRLGALASILASTLPAADTVTSAARRPALAEDAFDVTNRPIPENRQTPVDVNAQLQLRFVDASPARGAARGKADAPPDWQRLQSILEEVRAISAERKQLNQRIRTDPTARENPVRFRNEVLEPFNDRVDALLDKLPTLARPGEANSLQNIMTAGGGLSPYENLGTWIQREIVRLQTADRAEFAGHQVEVNVSAFLLRGNTAPKRIGVPGYDNIAIGNPEPIPRTSLRLTPEEAAQFQARLEATENVAGLLREIQDNWGSTNQDLSAALKTLAADARALARNLRTSANALNSLGDVERALTKLKDNASATAAQKDAAARLLAACAEFRSTAEPLTQEVGSIIELVQQVRTASEPAALVALAGSLGSVRSIAQQLDREIRAAAARFEPVFDRLNDAQLANDLETVAVPLALSEIEPLRELVEDARNVQKAFDPLLGKVKAIAAALGFSSDADKLPAKLADAKVDSTWFKTASAPDTHIALDTTGILPGDRVQVKVTYRTADGNTPPPEQFTVLATQFGLYRKIDASLVFARPLKEPAPGAGKRWRPNAAATAHWFYRWRPEQDGALTGGKRAWNFVNPGLGLHAASLAQGEDSVEVGLGVNLSLLDGMVSGGYGWNLSTEKPYVYVGIGLLEVLDRARNGTLTGGGGSK